MRLGFEHGSALDIRTVAQLNSSLHGKTNFRLTSISPCSTYSDTLAHMVNSERTDYEPLTAALNVFVSFISNVSEQARNMQLEDVAAGKVREYIDILMDDETLSTPYAEGIDVYFPKTFLYLLWAVCYYLFVVTETIMDQEMEGTYDGHLRSDAFTRRAYDLINYALTLRFRYLPWPYEVIDPNVDAEFARDVNVIFGYALAYVYFHEYAHVTLNHSAVSDAILSKDQEREADNFALDVVLGTASDDNTRRNYGIAVGCAGISMLYCVSDPKNLDSTTHPPVDIRLANSMSYLSIADPKANYYLYKLLCVGLVGFCDMYKIPVSTQIYDTIEDQYGDLLERIATRRTST